MHGVIFTGNEQQQSLLEDIEIANGSVSLKRRDYEKGVSFKCTETNGYNHPVRCCTQKTHCNDVLGLMSIKNKCTLRGSIL